MFRPKPTFITLGDREVQKYKEAIQAQAQTADISMSEASFQGQEREPQAPGYDAVTAQRNYLQTLSPHARIQGAAGPSTGVGSYTPQAYIYPPPPLGTDPRSGPGPSMR
ncbi:hypothetical protein HDV00_001129 [Rhizophlyctis rosea]|nr:hypothetical protein HDV00_001129 [Rhizophlyctis rosea]